MAIWEGCNHISGYDDFGRGTHLKEEREDAHQEGGRKNYERQWENGT